MMKYQFETINKLPFTIIKVNHCLFITEALIYFDVEKTDNQHFICRNFSRKNIPHSSIPLED